MNNLTVLNGFEDGLTFISQQQERIKRLEQDKATLVRENVELREENEAIEARRPNKTDLFRRLQKQIKQLEREKNDLQEQIKKLDRSKTGSYMKQRDSARKEIEDLKKTIGELKSQKFDKEY